MNRERLSTFLFMAIAVLTVVGELSGLGALKQAAAGCVVVFLILEYRHIPMLQRMVGTALMLGGVGMALLTDDPVAVLNTGVLRVLPFLLLFASVAWLQIPSAQSPSLLAVRETVLAQPPGRRFAWVAAVGHFLGVAFNLAGLSLLTPMVAKGVSEQLQKRLSRAMIQGFGAGTCWSPLYVGTAVIVASVPGASWIAVGPTGFVIAMGLLVWSWSVDRLFSRPRLVPPAEVKPPPPPLSAAIWAKLLAILITLFGCIIGLVEGLDWSIPIALAVTAPVYALCWAAMIRRGGTGDGARGMVQSVVTGLPGLRGEALLFTGANMLGVGIAALVPDGGAGEWIARLGLPSGVILVAIMVGYAMASAIGLHPVVTVVLVTSILTPEVIGVRPEILALALMVMWGQGTNISPFSATNLYMARVTGQSGWTTAWRWNGPMVIATTALLAAVMTVLNGIW